MFELLGSGREGGWIQVTSKASSNLGAKMWAAHITLLVRGFIEKAVGGPGALSS
jgi:hypothetical protein